MAYGPVPSSLQALERAGLSVGDIDRWEINEAFAGQAVACINDLGIDVEKVNVNGGAVGLGHPLAATGTRLVLTLAHELHRCGGRYGVATACIGGGQGIAMVIESISSYELCHVRYMAYQHERNKEHEDLHDVLLADALNPNFAPEVAPK